MTIFLKSEKSSRGPWEQIDDLLAQIVDGGADLRSVARKLQSRAAALEMRWATSAPASSLPSKTATVIGG
jgi:hypothetical protein